ncbi:MAG: hypothetical protein IPM51_17065 [Sphingobacteriaceae bacterium]|nr:hypothetical protein [Sphingobacteriaceae bacterium]
MADFTFNPYPQIGSQLTAGMDAVSGALTPASTVDELVNAVYNYIQPIYYPSSTGAVPKQIEIEIKSVCYNMINAYNNKLLGSTLRYSDAQMNIVSMMLGATTQDRTPINAINPWLLDLEDNISKAGMNISLQTPLLLGIQCGKSIYAYWVSKVATPGTWAPFFQTPAPLNYANIPFWLKACMEGALIGANATQKGLIAPTTDIVSVDIISALIGALTIGAGKVIFKWVPRIQPDQLPSPKLTLNKEMISQLNFDTGGLEGEIGGGAAMRPIGSSQRTGICICGPTVGPALCPSKESNCCTWKVGCHMD